MRFNLSQRVFQDPRYFIAFGFGTGLIPYAPGTWGTLAAIPLYLLLIYTSWPVYLFFVFIAFILGVWVADKVSRDLGVNDYKGIVWDEVVGYLLTMFLAPKGLFWIICGFILFRIFDIWKPNPIAYIDRKVRGGLGVMLDDVLAAVPSWLIMQILAWSFAS
jgi:phosphatidylglycerophosphatase A